MKKTVLILAALVPLVYILSCGGGGGKTYHGADFLPLEGGNYWVYDKTTELTAAAEQGAPAEVTLNVGGQAVFNDETTTGLVDTGGNVQYMTADSRGIRLHAEYDNSTGRVVRYDPPFTVYPAEFQTGQSFGQEVEISWTEAETAPLEGQSLKAANGSGGYLWRTTATYTAIEASTVLGGLDQGALPPADAAISVNLLNTGQLDRLLYYGSIENYTAASRPPHFLQDEMRFGGVSGIGHALYLLLRGSIGTGVFDREYKIKSLRLSGVEYQSPSDGSDNEADDCKDPRDDGAVVAILDEFTISITGITESQTAPGNPPPAGRESIDITVLWEGRVISYSGNLGCESPIQSAASPSGISGAFVTIQASTPDGGQSAYTATTNSSGVFRASAKFSLNSSGTLQSRVLDVEGESIAYLPEQNTTSDIIYCTIEENTFRCD